jgi:hypothetical protein
MTCSERDAERIACRLRRQKSARRSRIITKPRAPRAIPTLAPTLRPPLEEDEVDFATGESVASGDTVVVPVGDKDVVIMEVIIEPPLELVVSEGKLVGACVISDCDEVVAVGAKDIEAPDAGVWRVIGVEG